MKSYAILFNRADYDPDFMGRVKAAWEIPENVKLVVIWVGFKGNEKPNTPGMVHVRGLPKWWPDEPAYWYYIDSIECEPLITHEFSHRWLQLDGAALAFLGELTVEVNEQVDMVVVNWEE